MSLFLGRIHFWLFDKIKCFEDLEKEILKFAKERGAEASPDLERMYERIGPPTEEKPLEDQINTENIHGWLQYQIQKAEGRQAYLVKALLDIDGDYIKELRQIFRQHGAKTAAALERSGSFSPKEAYDILNDFLLEGMPCDRTIDFLEDSPTQFRYRYTRCLHKKYWEEYGSSIKDFYILRNEWISGFLSNLEETLTFEVTENDPDYEDISQNTFAIKKKSL